jgi:hypothetical protein
MDLDHVVKPAMAFALVFGHVDVGNGLLFPIQQLDIVARGAARKYVWGDRRHVDQAVVPFACRWKGLAATDEEFLFGIETNPFARWELVSFAKGVCPQRTWAIRAIKWHCGGKGANFIMV